MRIARFAVRYGKRAFPLVKSINQEKRVKDMGRDPKNPPAKKPTENREQAQVSQRRARRENRGGGDVADWANADAQHLIGAIAAISAKGCAIQFSYTRDGGSYCVRIVGDGEPYNEYVRPTEDINLYLQELTADFR